MASRECSTRSRTGARGTSRGIRACTSPSSWTVPVRGPLALGAGVGYGLGLFVPVREKNSSAVAEVTLKEIEAAACRPQKAMEFTQSLRASSVEWNAEAARALGAPGPGVGGRREVLVRAGAGGGGACAASPW